MKGKKRNKAFLVFILCLLIAACTEKEADFKAIDDTVLNENQIFADGELIATHRAQQRVLAFDDNNRPILTPGSMDCPPVMDDNDDTDVPIGTQDPPPPPPPPTCNPGFELDNEFQCVPICNDDQVFAQDQCHDRVKPCEVENGTGNQTWMANMYGECVATQCNDGFEVNNGSCVARCTDAEVYVGGECKPLVADCEANGRQGSMVWEDGNYGQCMVARDCDVENGTGIQDWMVEEQQYEQCRVVSCTDGFQVDGNTCVSRCTDNQVWNGKRCRDRVRDCRIAGGEGQQTWNDARGRFNRCRVTSCNDGFRRRGNSCIRDNWREEALGGDADPLIVDLGSDVEAPQGITLTSQDDGISFDILGQNSTPNPNDPRQISWTQNARYRWIVLPDINGQVNNIDEMFGENTLGPDMQFSSDGFEALSKYDTDRNGRIDADDPIYRLLGLWTDTNGNGVSDAGEIISLTEGGVKNIGLNFDPNFFEVDQYGNKTTYKSVVSFYNGNQSLIFDLWFHYKDPTTPGACPPAGSGSTSTPTPDSGGGEGDTPEGGIDEDLIFDL